VEVSDVKRLREPEEENARLKKMFAELSMNHDILKEVITKKVGAPATKSVNPGDCLRSRFDCNRSL
jgi:putative transposase